MGWATPPTVAPQLLRLVCTTKRSRWIHTDWPRPSYTFGHEERPQDPPLVRLTKNSILKNPVGKTGVEKRACTPSGFTHTPTLLMVVFGLASTVKAPSVITLASSLSLRWALSSMLLLHLLRSCLRSLHAFLFSLLFFFQNVVNDDEPPLPFRSQSPGKTSCFGVTPLIPMPS
jgi:hypothetical protein